MPVYGDRYMKTTMRRYGDEGYTVFCALNVPEDGVEYDFFTIISIDPYLFMRARCRQPKCRQPKCRQPKCRQPNEYLDEYLFDSDEN